MALTFVDQDEDLKYTLWSDYVNYFQVKSDGTAKIMSYFAWLDFYGLT